MENAVIERLDLHPSFVEVQAAEAIGAMNRSQKMDILSVVRCMKKGDKEAAFALIDKMDCDTLDLLLAYIEAAQAERSESATA